MIDNDRVRNHVFDGYEWKNVNNFYSPRIGNHSMRYSAHLLFAMLR